jgi:AcrR family transcriptional regulator
LLNAALRLFADKGFARTSVREIAQCAGSNVAAISYYFGDKAGLYRAAFYEPIGPLEPDAIAAFADPRLSLREALEGIVGQLTAPIKQGEMAHLSLRLRNREIVESTGLLAEDWKAIRYMLDVLSAVLQRHLGLAAVDEEIQRLTFSIFALSVQQLSYPELLRHVYPGMVDAPSDYQAQILRTVRYAEALVEGERKRRSGHAA